MDTQAMTLGGGTPDDIQAQRDKIPDVVRKETTVLTDSLRKELKQLINEVLDERELQVKLNGPYDFPEYDGNLDISINTSGQDVITFS
tara:strand:+ start:141 stop:404 length:264 start_codon:yes stop_codon:yes gene_type:complete